MMTAWLWWIKQLQHFITSYPSCSNITAVIMSFFSCKFGTCWLKVIYRMLLSWFLNAGAKLPLTHLMTTRNMKLDQLKEGVSPPTVSNHMWTTTNELELSWVSILKIKSSRQLINWDRYQLSLCSAGFHCITAT